MASRNGLGDLEYQLGTVRTHGPICQLNEMCKAAMLHAQVIIGDSHNFVRADEAAVNIEPPRLMQKHSRRWKRAGESSTPCSRATSSGEKGFSI